MADDAETADAIGKIPGLIKASREDFARLYDAEALAHDGANFTPLHVLVQVERLLNPTADTGSDAFAFALAFREAEAHNWARDLVRRVVMARMVSMPGEKAAITPDQSRTLDHIGQLAQPEPGTLQVALQANVNPADGYLDPLSLAAEMNLITRRVCQVLVDRQRKGTGFLVGPQVVLTNWHVVRGLYLDDADGPITAIRDNRLKVVFDQFKAPVAGVGPALAAGGAAYFVTSIDAANAAYQQEYAGEAIDSAKELWAGDSEKLDFALLRLDGLPGIERGWYGLAKDIWPATGASIYLAQYPGQYALKVTSGKFDALCDDNVRRRVRHLANAAGGSSGGLCLSFDGQTATLKPSALHQASVVITAGADGAGKDSVLNQAVPLAKIAPLIESLARQADAATTILRLGAASGPDHVGAPVLGRGTFQKHVAEAISGEARILIVRPAVAPGQPTAGLGKSFSAVLLRSLLSPDGHLIASFKASEIPTDAKACAQAILQRIAPAQTDAVWASSDSALTTESAWINDVLIDQDFTPRLKSAARGRIVWLVIDDLDRVDLPDAGGRRFLDAIYQRIETIPELRILLIGLTRDLTSFPLQKARVDLLDHAPGEAEVTQWLIRRFGSERAIDPDLLQSFSRLTLAAASAPGSSALAQAIRDKLDQNLPPEFRNPEATP